MSYNATAIYEVLTLAIDHHRHGRYAEAEKLYRAILNAAPQHPDANYNFAMLAVDLGYLKESLPYFEQAIESHSIAEPYYVSYIETLLQLGETDKAKQSFEDARWVCSQEILDQLAHKLPASTQQPKLNLFELINSPHPKTYPGPTAKEAEHWNLLYRNGLFAEAETFSRKMTESYPKSGLAWKMLGIILIETAKFQESLHPNRMAIKWLPKDPEVFYNFALASQELGMTSKAIEGYLKAIELKQDYYQAYGNLGVIFQTEGKFSKAVEYCRKTISLDPNAIQPYNNLAISLRNLGKFDEAFEPFKKALELNPNDEDTYGNYLFGLNYNHEKSAEEIFEAYREYDRRFALPLLPSTLLYANNRNPHRRLKIGYVSPDFKHHAARNFLEPLLKHHDSAAVEVYAYAELKKEDTITQSYKRYIDHWVPTIGMSDETLAKRIQNDEIDILIELAGHTAGNRLSVFARKPAPVSVSWLGYGYTTGLTAIDYYLTDEISVPEGSEHLFSEKPWKIESPSYAYSPPEGTGEVNTLPALTNNFITFGTLTRSIRINPRTIRVWSELLKRIPNAKLIINSGDFRELESQKLLAERFHEYGVEKERLEIGFHTPPWDVLRRMDIGLDCFPHNSGTTLFETLYMGVPYVTLADRVSVGRIGSAILHGIGHDEWIARTEEEYIEKLVVLSSDLPALAKIRQELRDEMLNSPLMDGAGFARKVEKAYQAMFQQWCETSR
jgi:predicted O-linked N-acetylglucosamine transferase (SPINDLY family)